MARDSLIWASDIRVVASDTRVVASDTRVVASNTRIVASGAPFEAIGAAFRRRYASSASGLDWAVASRTELNEGEARYSRPHSVMRGRGRATSSSAGEIWQDGAMEVKRQIGVREDPECVLRIEVELAVREEALGFLLESVGGALMQGTQKGDMDRVYGTPEPSRFRCCPKRSCAKHNTGADGKDA